MTDRIVGLVLLAFSVGYGWLAQGYEANFGDPLGPAGLPTMLAVPAALLSLALIFKPDPDPEWAKGGPLLRQAAALATLIGYAFFLETLGFLLATVLAVTVLARLLRTTWVKAAISAVATAGLLFLAFDKLLGLPLDPLPGFMS